MRDNSRQDIAERAGVDPEERSWPAFASVAAHRAGLTQRLIRA